MKTDVQHMKYFKFYQLPHIAAILLLIVLSSCAEKAKTNSQPNMSTQTAPFSTPEIDAKVDSILSIMTMDEKIAQITGTRLREIMVDGKVSIDSCRKKIGNGIGHFCQFSSGQALEPEELRDLVREVQNYLINETRLGIPAIFHEEAITGFATQGATTFPQQIGVGCSWNPDQVRKNTANTAQNMRAAGATFALSPMLDISRTAHWNRHQESYGEDPYLTSKMGVAFVEGLQGDDFKTGIAATVKHFAGYGTKNDDERELYENYLMPHEAAIKIAGVKSVMPSYGVYEALPVTANPTILDKILREQIGFDGLVVSDYGAINQVFKKYKRAEDVMTAGAMALHAGVDIELSSPTAFPELPRALEKGLVTEKDINEAVRRSLTMKAKLGLLDKNPKIGKDGALDFDSPAARQLAYETACQSVVLLKNDGILPVKNDVTKIALVGPNADAVHGLLGDYTYQGMRAFWKGKQFDKNNPKLVTLKEGLENRLDGTTQVLYERGCDWSAPLEAQIDKKSFGDDRLSKLKLITISDQPQPDLRKALKIANESDVVIAAMGENLYLNGEGRWRKGIGLPGEQENFVKQLIATGKPVVLVIFSGRQQFISNIVDECSAIVQAWFPGEEGGNAVADILLGNVNPSGKLCVSYPSTEAQVEMNYKDGYHGIAKPLYPFGYGLSYTQYSYSALKMPSSIDVTDDHLSISFNVKNIGQVNGTEIVQLYVSPVDPNSTMKAIELRGFERVPLKAGEEKTVTFEVSPKLLAQFVDRQWSVEPGKYEFKVGASSADIQLSKEITLKGDDHYMLNGRQVFFANSKVN